MTSTPPPPPRRTREIVLVVIGVVLSLLALALPVVPVGRGALPLSVAPFLYPVQRASDAIALVLVILLFAALIVPHPLLIRAVVTRRSGGIARLVVVVAGVGALLWGLFLSAFAFSPGHLFAVPAVLALILAGITSLIAQAAILGRLDPVSRRWR